ncbi:MAG TPA: SDR family oxidoreductase [Terriglobales bacterium]|nr:SDR family oxidoreductase [Terriglobales bacterium]
MILVTGAGGNVGSELVKKLVASGTKVRGMYYTIAKRDQAPKGVEAVVGDYGDRKAVAKAMEGVKKTYLVCSPLPQLPALEGHIIEEAARSGVKHIVKQSVIGAGSGGGHMFGKWHAQAEEKLVASGVPYTILRPNTFMQNFLGFAGSIKTQGAIFGCSGEAPVSYVDARDIAGVAAKILSDGGHEGKAYELTGAQAVNYAWVAALISKLIGKQVKYVDLPAAELKKFLLQVGMQDWLADGVLDLQAYNKTGKAAAVSNAVEQVTGKKPITFEQFAQDFASAFAYEAGAAR